MFCHRYRQQHQPGSFRSSSNESRAMETTGPDKGAAGHRAVRKNDPDYPLNRGVCIIIDVRNPTPVTIPGSRRGQIAIGKRRDSSLVDKLQKTFEQWGFQVKVYVDPATEELFKILKKEAKDNWDIVACCFLTFVHPMTGDLCTQNGSVSIKDLTETFDGANASNLLGKPKLFFIHTSKRSREMSVCSGFSDTTSRNTLPGEPDFFICTSGQQTEGKESTDAFIEHFCKVFDTSAKTMEQQDFTALLQEVNRELLNAAVDTSDIRLPSHISSLTRQLYFHRVSEQSGSSTRVPETEETKKEAIMHGTLKGSQKELLEMTTPGRFISQAKPAWLRRLATFWKMRKTRLGFKTPYMS
ncbi:caspase-7-like isoform X1 [Ornithodoros turicata]|uniref:caspase-7-like isoform X1 n=2 Tax=Ornithodoros turicata TaxID=34597 RepID=UPI0031389F5B